MKHSLISILITVSSLFACGGWFPDRMMQEREMMLRYLPDMSFSDDTRFLCRFTVERKKFHTDSLFAAGEESLWVNKQLHTALKIARSAGSETALASASKTLPEDLALYLHASFLFNHTDTIRFFPSAEPDSKRLDPRQTYRALILYNKLINMDKTSKKPLTVRAMFMKGRCFQRLLMRDSANACFRLTEELVQNGAPDRLNLVWFSMGEQGRNALQRKDPVKALEHYIRQAVTHDSSADAISMQITISSILSDDSLTAKALKNPAMEFLIASYLYNRFSMNDWMWAWRREPYDDSTTEVIAGKVRQNSAIIKKAPKQHPLTRDRFAAAAYRMDQFALAEELVNSSNSGLAWWIKAKAAVQKKQMNKAAYCYSKAVEQFHKDQPHEMGWKSEADLPHFNEQNEFIRPLAESAIVAVIRGEFTTALKTLWNTKAIDNPWWSYWVDFAYVAERLVTTDQLKSFTDSVTLPKPPVRKQYEDRADLDLRLLLARRLMREHRYAEALPYFQNNPWYGDSTMPQLKQLAKQYISISDSVKTTVGSNQAEQLFTLAQITRKWGMELMGTEIDPDWTVYGGGESEGDWEYLTDSSKIDRIDSSSGYNNTIYHQIPVSRYRFEPGFATSEEYRRLKASQSVPYRRYHYRWLASDLAVQSAHLVPKRSQAFAAILTKAYWYIANHDSVGSRKIYNYYRRSNPKYDFDTYKVPDWKGARKMAPK